MDKKGVHSLGAAEDFLKRDISESSSKLEKDCFQIAFVIFVMGHVLAPSTKHDYGSIDFWGALVDTENIGQFNWCEYVVQCMLAGVRRIKTDIRSGNMATNLVGCHLFLQIFLLDNHNLFMMNKPHSVLPRASVFDQDSFRKMIIHATDVGKSTSSYASAPIRYYSLVCYARSKHGEVEKSDSRHTAKSPQRPATSCAGSSAKSSRKDLPSPSHAPHLIHEMMPTTICMLGPSDFLNYLNRQYPHLASDEMTVLLKELNARCLSHITTTRRQIQLEMMRFADKLYGARTRICTCCTTRAHAVPPRATSATKDGGVTTPATTPFAGRRLELSPCEGITSTSKRTKTVRTHQCPSEPRMESALRHVLQTLNLFAKQNLNGISELYIDLPNDATTTIFGQRSNDLPGCKYVSRPGFETNPWCRGVVTCPPQPGVAHLIQQHLLNADGTELAGNFIVHEEPRFIRITSFVIPDQLTGNNIIGHELMSILFRRFAQIDCDAETENPFLRWRHPLEPELRTMVLLDSDFLHTVSIQKQLSADSLKYDLTSTQMFITAVPRPEGWMVIIWDM
ncbi:uncharacterized protein LOC125540089 isoform X1 [Triticum urartu]|uniref:uncharacterized protein LOC125540089 isoform X1 n=1 Tax=Triticum urartu TaxID=4572 RepID=UPI002043A85D|nr:uncharacterized protein LOC125540089 isoform X1 [Triticum urartu]XP_048559624.1 uncharacterized protein LOC125540089 isoform X1 [Triticum urartu]XP_048559625.1 uncharacterized protein LOC125540089 isoform X1 [Triticum urartu]XP_048559626.1 uncharacterized protein LOC125540089 isoform X1 [Triticum urartu]XP_048559628.1 uncharacterized protein LOC125540089 isoform X1 [Triticum urartu]XP_048559629.1 uncharacterized protein LOC125540089 isoform X1 [Triticum urartu]